MNKYSTRILHDKLKVHVLKEMEKEEFEQSRMLAESRKKEELEKSKFKGTPWM